MSIFSNVDFNNQEVKADKWHKHEDVISIKVTTVTPLMQMDTDSLQRKRYVLDSESGHTYREPFYSANGLRGFARRTLYKNMLKAVYGEEKPESTDVDSFFVFTSGAGTDKKSIEEVDYKIEETIRTKLPILSLFGAGLSQIAGKVAIDDMRPVDENKFNVVKNKNGETMAVSNFIESHTFIRDDSSRKLGMLKELVNQDDLAAWSEAYEKEVALSKAKKQSGETSKESATNMGQLVNIECIRPDVTLATCINPITSNFTNLELAALVHTLYYMSSEQIGSAKRYGYGKLDWYVELNGEKIFTLKRGEYSSVYTKELSPKGQELFDMFSDYLNNLTEDDIIFSKVVEKAKKA